MKDREKEWLEQKTAYMEQKMSAVQVEEMKKKIEQAKWENHKENHEEKDMERNKGNRHTRRIAGKIGMAVAAAVAVMVVLPNTSAGIAQAMEKVPLLSKWVEVVTFREYQYEDERNYANIEVPKLAAEEAMENTKPEQAKEPETQLAQTTEEINAQIEQISAELIAEFEEGLQAEEGYQSMSVTSQVVASTDTCFTLQLNCFQAAGSGAEWNYYYTIDLRSGKQLTLADLFQEGADYITPVSENIKKQMREQMAADDMVMYWLDDPEVEEWNFDKITEETNFYLNEEGELVIAFNEGDVAPMYMGCVQFVIPDEVLSSIRK